MDSGLVLFYQKKKAAMVKSIVLAVLESLGSLIPEEMKQNVGLALGIEEEIRKMTANFQDIQSVLQDAETKQVRGRVIIYIYV